MRLITGDECGLLKECLPEKTRSSNKSHQKQQSPPQRYVDPRVVSVTTNAHTGVARINPATAAARRHAIVGLTWIQPQQDQSFASLRVDGVVQVWERSNNSAGDNHQDFGRYRPRQETTTTTHVNVFQPNNKDNNNTSIDSLSESDKPSIQPATKPLSLFALSPSNNDPDSVRLCACNALGDVVLLNPNNADNDDESDNAPFVVSRFSTVQQRGGNSHTDSFLVNKFGNPYITATALDARHGRVALGGQERDATLFDLSTQQQVWKAKNLGADPQTLLPPQVWPSAMTWLEADVSLGQNLLAVGSAHKEVRLYDVRTSSDKAIQVPQRRPISYTPNGLLEYRVTDLCLTDPFSLVVADAAGDVHTLDLRTLGKDKKDAKVKTQGRYVGPAGSVRQMQVHQDLPVLAAVGLDRMLRLYDTQTRRQLHCIYLRQRLNCVLFGQEGDWNQKKKQHGEDDEEDYVDDNGDIDQEDQVRDYQNSDDDDEEEEDDESGKDRPVTGEEDDEKNAFLNNNKELRQDNDGDDSSDSDDDSDDGDDSDDNDDESSGEEPATKKRRRTG